LRIFPSPIIQGELFAKPMKKDRGLTYFCYQSSILRCIFPAVYILLNLVLCCYQTAHASIDDATASRKYLGSLRLSENPLRIQSKPSITSEPERAVMEDEEYRYDITTSDPDPDEALTITAPEMPRWLRFEDNGDGTANLSGTPENEDVGIFEITIVVEDKSAEKDEQEYSLEVINTNDTPVITSEPLIEGTVEDGYEYYITFEDIDVGDVAKATLISSLPPGFQFINISGSNTAVLRGAQGNIEVGEYEVIIAVTDLAGSSVEQSFTMIITEGNRSPEFVSEPKVVAVVGSEYTYNIQVEDPDAGDVIIITCGTLPPWLTFTDNGDGTATLAGIPGPGDVGFVSISLTAKDNSTPTPGNAGQIFTLEVIESIHAPEITSTPVETIEEDAYYQYNIVATDLDEGDILRISAQDLPDWLNLNDLGDGKALLSGIPRNADVGSVTVTLTATDLAGNKNIQTFTINVINTNDDPSIASDPVISVLAGETYSYTIIVLDQDPDDKITISVSGLPSWLSLEDNGDGTAVLTGVPGLSEVGIYEISVMATDMAGANATQVFSVEVIERNFPPEITSEPVTSAELSAEYVYAFTATDPNEGDQLLILFTASPGFLSLIDNGDGTANIVGVPQLSDLGIHQVEIRVEDSEGAFVLQSFQIEVFDPSLLVNDPPVITDFDLTSDEDTPLAFTSDDFLDNFNDPDGDEALSIYIEQAPDNGTLFLGGTELSAPASFPATEINSLVYIPLADYNGPDHFNWNADDGEFKAETNARVNIGVLPVNDPPEDLTLSKSTVEEGQPAGTVIGTLAAVDVDVSDNHTFRFATDNTGDVDAFDISGDQLTTGIVLDYSIQKSFEITIIGDDGNGGMVEESFVIRVLPSETAFLQNGITPNGDGLNDTWAIEGLENCSDCLVEIFNRWGQKIFHSIGYEQKWDGTFEGEELPTGTYYYVIDYKNEKPPRKGAISILR